MRSRHRHVADLLPDYRQMRGNFSIALNHATRVSLASVAHLAPARDHVVGQSGTIRGELVYIGLRINRWKNCYFFG
jgi:hypothetical protein